MPSQNKTAAQYAFEQPNNLSIRWLVCFLLFLATTINYMDRSVFSLIEPLLHLHFMGWVVGFNPTHQSVYDMNYGRVVITFQIAYGFGFLFAGRIMDKMGTRFGYALAILIWGCASVGTSLVNSVAGLCVARAILGLGESGNFPAAVKAVTEWFAPDERALATGLFNSGSNAAAFVGPVLIDAATARFGWHAAFLVPDCWVSSGLSYGCCFLTIGCDPGLQMRSQSRSKGDCRQRNHYRSCETADSMLFLRSKGWPTRSSTSIFSICPSSSMTATTLILVKSDLRL